jgi:hypothetical protein
MDGTIVGGEEWQQKVYNSEQWKRLLKTERNCRILHVAMEGMHELTLSILMSYV